MKLGILSDLHLGGSGEGRWHNRQLLSRAEEIVRSAVEVANSQGLDLVMVLGDITQSGAEAQLRLAHELLSSLTVPWLVIPGNHDRAAVASGQFDQVFAEHAPGLYSRWDEIGVLCLRENVRGWIEAPSRLRLGPALIDEAAEAVAADRPRTVFVFSHFQLVSEESFANENRGLYAGNYEDGLELLRRLEATMTGRVVAFCGHQHWHHVMTDPRWIQCTTGAMIEYPMELRIALAEPSRLRLSILPGAPAALAAESLVSAGWVRGRERDRDAELSLTP